MPIEAAVAEHAQPKAKIFISYSRKDVAFANRLDAALRARGFEPKIDREEIYAFENWWDRIRNLIIEADTVVFVLSPDAVASEVCAREVEFATSLHKRFAPIVCRRVADEAVPQVLRELNFIFLDDESQFEHGAAKLADALVTDIDWVRKHTEFGTLAQRWAAAGRPGPRGLLLRSSVLEEAEHWIASRPANAPTPTEITRTFIAESRGAARRRRNFFSAGLCVGMCVALGLAGLAYWQRGIAVEQERIARKQRDSALLTQSRFLSDRANALTRTGDPMSATLLALEALRGGLSAFDRPYLAEAESALFGASQGTRELSVWRGGLFAFSPDGTQIATIFGDAPVILGAKTRAIRATLEGHIKPKSIAFTPDGRRIVMASDKVSIWDAVSGRRIAVLPDDDFNLETHVTPDGRRAVTDGPDRSFKIWDVQTAKPIRIIQGDEFSMSSDGRRIVVYAQKSAQVWDVDTGARLSTLEMDMLPESPLLSADGRRIVATSSDRKLRLWNADTGQSIAIIADDADPRTFHGAFSPDGSRLVIAPKGIVSTVTLWDVEAGKMIAPLGQKDAGVFSIVFSPDNTVVATIEPGAADDEGILRLWESNTGEVLAQPVNGVSAVRFSSDSRRMVTVLTSPPSALLCLLGEGGGCVTLAGHTDKITDARFSPDGARLATSSRDGTLRLWDAEVIAQSPPPHLIVTAADGYANCAKSMFSYPTIAFSEDDQRAVTLAGDEVSIWEVKTLRCIATLTGHSDLITSAVFSPDGRRIATASLDHTARIWNADTGAPIAALTGHQGDVLDVSFSPDGRRIVTTAGTGIFVAGAPNSKPADTTARIWDADTGTLVATLAGHTDSVNFARFSSDGARILTISRDRTARIWDAKTGKMIASIADPNASQIHMAAFSPDGSRIAAAFGYSRLSSTRPSSTKVEKGVQIFDGTSGRLLYTLDATDEIATVVFSPDGNLIATVSDTGMAQVWSVDRKQMVAVFLADRAWPGVTFSTNSERIAIRSGDGIGVWDIASAKAVAALKLNATFNFYDRRVRPVAIDGLYRIWRNYQTTAAVLAFALRITTRCLTTHQHEEVALSPEPVEWCIENKKWPYDTAIWKEWLNYKKANLGPPMPDSSGWPEWLRRHQTGRAQ